MDLPFTTEQFLDLFRDYNMAIWPAQVIAYVLGVVAVALTVRRRSFSDRAISAILALSWIWIGTIYHLAFFSKINPAAYLFGSLFIVQGVLLLLAGVVRRDLVFGFRYDAYGVVGSVLIVYALLVYPILGMMLGHSYPYSPMFGVAPCPATIFTFGMLMWTRGRVPAWLLIIPLVWSFVGLSAALQLGIFEDTGLLLSGLLGTSMLLYRNRHTSRQPAVT